MFSTNIVKVVKVKSLTGAESLPLEDLGEVQIQKIVRPRYEPIKSRVCEDQPEVAAVKRTCRNHAQKVRIADEELCLQILKAAKTELTVNDVRSQLAAKGKTRSYPSVAKYLGSLVDRNVVERRAAVMNLRNTRRSVNLYRIAKEKREDHPSIPQRKSQLRSRSGN